MIYYSYEYGSGQQCADFMCLWLSCYQMPQMWALFQSIEQNKDKWFGVRVYLERKGPYHLLFNKYSTSPYLQT